jgi:hypothetical protein
MCAGVFTAWVPLLWIGSVLLGAAQAGANLGWNLGHNDFASVGRAQHYMGVHVTLTGLRGGVAPPLGVLVYMGLERSHPGAGEFALVLPLAILRVKEQKKVRDASLGRGKAGSINAESGGVLLPDADGAEDFRDEAYSSKQRRKTQPNVASG